MANSLADILAPGKQVADAAIGIGKGVLEILQQAGVVDLNDKQKAEINATVQDGLIRWNDQLIKVYETETKDIQSARNMQTSLLVDAPRWIKGVAALVVPFGGIMALSVFFFNILAPNIAILTGVPFRKIDMTLEEALTVDGIIGFFFVYRWRSKLAGVAGKY
ncbi:MAG: hypothetical protein HY891_05515 [Deltaproteobacteria bacterium]|nr:hypothetical protein [Deltaproteobacteria bacterium]